MSREGHVEFVSLSAVADVDAGLELDFAGSPLLFLELLLGLVFKGRKFCSKLSCGSFSRDSPENCSRIILNDIADEDAESGERSRGGWHNDARDCERLGQF